jgi:MraZ protein
MEYANTDKDIVLFAYGNKIEVWNKEAYQKALEMDEDEFADLAEDVMGLINNNDDDLS